MGGQQSTPVTAAQSEKLILERLRSFKVEDGDYLNVKVGGEAEKTEYHEHEQVRREPEGLPVSSLELWIDNVMKDPKNR